MIQFALAALQKWSEPSQDIEHMLGSYQGNL